MPNATRLLRSGLTRRYHTEPLIVGAAQTVAEHSWGVVALILAYHPAPSLNLIERALFHDIGESFTGDMPHWAKAAEPKVYNAIERMEEAEQARLLDRVLSPLNQQEQDWLAACDLAEAVFYLRNQKRLGNRNFDETIEHCELKLLSASWCPQEIKQAIMEEIVHGTERERESLHKGPPRAS